MKIIESKLRLIMYIIYIMYNKPLNELLKIWFDEYFIESFFQYRINNFKFKDARPLFQIKSHAL